MSYELDIEQAALSDPGFDKANAEDIGRHHGEDPKHVLADIARMRALLNPPREPHGEGALI